MGTPASSLQRRGITGARHLHFLNSINERESFTARGADGGRLIGILLHRHNDRHLLHSSYQQFPPLLHCVVIDWTISEICS